jgi:alcohol dehydrogenase (cytochrome c)
MPACQPSGKLITHDWASVRDLAVCCKSNVRSLKLAYAVAIGGTSANENLESTPLAEDGYLYVVDQWSVV